MTDFEGGVAIVTGAAMGLGAAIARELAVSGVRLVLGALDMDRADALAAEIGRITSHIIPDLRVKRFWVRAGILVSHMSVPEQRVQPGRRGIDPVR